MTTDVVGVSGKSAIVTGGAMGIGAGIVRRFAAAGANVVLATDAAVTADRIAVAV